MPEAGSTDAQPSSDAAAAIATHGSLRVRVFMRSIRCKGRTKKTSANAALGGELDPDTDGWGRMKVAAPGGSFSTMRLALFSAGVAIVLSTSGSATANGRYPASNKVVFSPSDPELVVVRATYGVLLSKDLGTTWTWICESALGLPATTEEDPPLGVTAAGSIVVGTQTPVGGLDVSSDMGCTWSCEGGALTGQNIVDITVVPEASHSVIALASTFVFDDGESSADAGPMSDTQLFESTDDGATWTAFGAPIDPTLLVDSVEVANDDPNRVYVSATRGFGPSRTGWLLVSNDAAATWTAQPVPLNYSGRNQADVFIGGVDPTDADRVYLRTDGQSDLLVSEDAGMTFQSVLSFVGEMLGFALSSDGSTIYAGGVEDGLSVGTRDSMTFAHTSSVDVQCLAYQGGSLWACASDDVSGFVVGVSADDGATFTPKLHLDSASAPIACEAQDPFACWADASSAQCSGGPFATLCSLTGCEGDAAGASVGGALAEVDASTAGSPSAPDGAATTSASTPETTGPTSQDAGRGAAGGETDHRAGSGGCATPARGASTVDSSFGYAIGAAVLVLRRIRRRQRRRALTSR